MSTVDDWKTSTVSEGSIVRVRPERGTKPYLLRLPGGFWCARVRKLDYEAGTVRITLCKQETAEPLTGQDAGVSRHRHSRDPIEELVQEWLQEQGVEGHSELTVTVDLTDLNLMKVFEEDDYPWNGVCVDDYVGFVAPFMGVSAGGVQQGTVVGLDPTEQTITVKLSVSRAPVEKFLMSKVQWQFNNGPRGG
ncbi:hypothetical protein [Streptomyces sp. Je 1-369]|uniref:hypothetical protein n=1 Tax=Streptomyces sp. Je 1-369 TaxID=2966192 RepID=UPI0022855079|nr:hypothetical protein [Streptomyces sp. Je 1-369]WAL93251.1 hypothetical protein NOO62_01345 [Streptomyces sp. Je 1-369]